MLSWTLIDVLVRNWAIVAISLTIVTLVVVPMLVLLRYTRIALNIMRNTKPPLARNLFDFEPLNGEPVQFFSFDGLPLAGLIARAPANVPRRGLVVFAHEYTSDMSSCGRYCRPLREAGYDIFAFDFRGHGRSDAAPDYTPRQWITDHDMHDICGAIAFITGWLREQGRPIDIALFGVSRGACAAILAAEEFDNVRVVISDGGFSTDTTIEYFMQRWASIFAGIRLMVSDVHPPALWRCLRMIFMFFAHIEFRCRFPSVRKAIQRMAPRPILFIHGEKDSYLPVEQSRKLYSLAPQPKYLWIAPAARHNQAVELHPDQYSFLTQWYLDRYLAGIPRDGLWTSSVPDTAGPVGTRLGSAGSQAAGALASAAAVRS